MVQVLVNDIIRIKLKSRFLTGVPAYNIFHYLVTSEGLPTETDNALDAMGYGFWANIRTALKAITANSVVYTEVQAFRLDAAGDEIVGESFSLSTAEGQGGVASESLPPFVSYGYRYNRQTTDFRHGYKRFMGVPEANQINGTLAAAAQTNVNALATALAASVTAHTDTFTPFVGGATMIPVIQRRTLNGDELATPLYQTPSSIVFVAIGTQNSRKFQFLV